MHTTIERKLVTDVFTERDHAVILQSARNKPSPYHVRQVKQHEFRKMDGSYFLSIRPGKNAGDHTVHDLRGLRYHSNGQVQHKLSFSEATDWTALPQRIQNQNNLRWNQIFQNPIPIKARKYNDLQSMKHVMPAECHHFFDNLPHE